MAERSHGRIVDFHLGAFDTEKTAAFGRGVAIAYGYDKPRHVTPRTPVARMYTEQGVYLSWDEVEARRIRWGERRLRALGLVSIQHVLNDEDADDAELCGDITREERDEFDTMYGRRSLVGHHS